MLSKRSIIGLILGSLIIGAAGYSLLTKSGPTVDMTEHFTIAEGMPITLTIPAPANVPQLLQITGDTFDLKLHSPGDGKQIPNTSYKNQLELEWMHVEDGNSKVLIQNTGNKELEITAITKQTPNPFGFTIDLMVLTTGVVVIGFSMGFTMRKPKGF